MPRLADVIAGFAFPPCHRHAAQKVTFDISNVFVSDPFKGSPKALTHPIWGAPTRPQFGKIHTWQNTVSNLWVMRKNRLAYIAFSTQNVWFVSEGKTQKYANILRCKQMAVGSVHLQKTHEGVEVKSKNVRRMGAGGGLHLFAQRA